MFSTLPNSEMIVGHNIQWDNATKTVLLHEYLDGASKEDLYQLVQKSAEMLKTVRHIVHLIIDERKINLMLSLADISFIERWKPRNQGVIVLMVTPEHFKQRQAMIDLMQRMGMKTADNVYYVRSVDDARQLLQQGFGILYP